jgi:hypothetical protein
MKSKKTKRVFSAESYSDNQLKLILQVVKRYNDTLAKLNWPEDRDNYTSSNE